MLWIQGRERTRLSYMGTDVGNNDPFGMLFDLHKGVCKVGTDSGSGTGFLCKFSVQGRRDRVHGIITNSYTLDVRDLANPFVMTFDIIKGGKKTPYEKTINPKDHFRFSCAVLEVTFVHFREDEVSDLKSKGRIFLELAGRDVGREKRGGGADHAGAGWDEDPIYQRWVHS